MAAEPSTVQVVPAKAELESGRNRQGGEVRIESSTMEACNAMQCNANTPKSVAIRRPPLLRRPLFRTAAAPSAHSTIIRGRWIVYIRVACARGTLRGVELLHCYNTTRTRLIIF